VPVGNGGIPGSHDDGARTECDALGKDTASINNLGINASPGACCVDNISTTRL
jgi:hypothetical protein